MDDNALFPNGAALVVGASGGIGTRIAEVLADDGCDLALVYNRKPDAAKAVSARVPTRATTHGCDVTDRTQIENLVSDVLSEHGRIHTLVWAAGPLVDQLSLSETPLEKWRNAFEIEVHGFFALAMELLAHMRESGGGSIVHLGSAGHLRWPERDGLSVAPKASNESWLKGIAREEGRYGIRANSVLVGVIDAGMFHELMAQGAFSEAWVAETQRMLSIKRWGKPEEIGYAVSWLASNRAAYVTGQQINVSGGYGI